MVGVAYDRGEGVLSDPKEALQWYRKAAEQGYGAAEYAVGQLLAAGRGVTRDAAEAVNWFRRGAGHGEPAAEFRLAQEYQAGRNVPRDLVEAYAWFNLAAARGHSEAGDARDRLEAEMKPDQLAQAETRSSELAAQVRSPNAR
jgi:TPR repeat protein